MAANRRAAAESAKDDDVDSSEVCTPLRGFFFFVSDVLSRHAFSWHSSLAKYARRMTEAKKCSFVITATAVRRFCF